MKAAIPHGCNKNVRPKITYAGTRGQKQFQGCYPSGNVVLNMNLPRVALITDSAPGTALRQQGWGHAHTFFKE